MSIPQSQPRLSQAYLQSLLHQWLGSPVERPSSSLKKFVSNACTDLSTPSFLFLSLERQYGLYTYQTGEFDSVSRPDRLSNTSTKFDIPFGPRAPGLCLPSKQTSALPYWHSFYFYIHCKPQPPLFSCFL